MIEMQSWDEEGLDACADRNSDMFKKIMSKKWQNLIEKNEKGHWKAIFDPIWMFDKLTLNFWSNLQVSWLVRHLWRRERVATFQPEGLLYKFQQKFSSKIAF